MTRNGTIVVGVDGSDRSRAAVRWAAQEAAWRGLRLRIVAAAGLDALMPSVDTMVASGASESFWREVTNYQESQAKAAADEAVDLARQAASSVEPEAAVYAREPAVRVLQLETESADVLVLGSSSETGPISSRLGSTAVAITQVAACPVVVVHNTVDVTPGAADGRVVVGVDGSSSSQRAVEFAFADAASRGVGLTAVHAWTMPRFPETVPARYEVMTRTRPTFEEEAAGVLSTALAELRQQHPDVSVEEQVVEGHPAEVLVSAAQDSPLLVVGSRGRGGLTGLLLGSVSHAVLHRAECPVAVIPNEK